MQHLDPRHRPGYNNTSGCPYYNSPVLAASSASRTRESTVSGLSSTRLSNSTWAARFRAVFLSNAGPAASWGRWRFVFGQASLSGTWAAGRALASPPRKAKRMRIITLHSPSQFHVLCPRTLVSAYMCYYNQSLPSQSAVKLGNLAHYHQGLQIVQHNLYRTSVHSEHHPTGSS